MEYRGFSKDCHKLLDSVPGLRALLDQVCEDPACCVQVRHNYLNCYYRGGSLFKMKLKPRSKPKLAFEFDPKYFELKQAPCSAHEDLKVWIESGSCDPKRWLEHLEELKQTMDAWLSEHPKAERETQQEIVKLNTFAKGNYQTIDIELAIPKSQESGRMDMIAVRREGEQYVPVVVELKHGTKAFGGKSGIQDHYQKITQFLDSKDGEAYLIETIRRIWATKKELGLLEEPVPNADAFEKAELMFAVTSWKGSPDDIRKRIKEETLSRTVLVAISPTKELYFDSGKPL